MKVAYIGNVGAGSAPHSTENEVRRALEHLGVEVVPLHEQRFDWSPSAVRDAAFVLWTHTHGFAGPSSHRRQAKFLEAMSRRSVPVVGYHLDRWWDLQRERQVGREPFFRVDLLCTADGGNDDRWAEHGVNHVWIPPAVSAFECVPGTPRDEFRSEVAFVGSWQGYHPESRHRAELVDWLRSTYPGRVALWPRPGEHAVRGEALRDLYASVGLVVGDSCLAGTGKNARYVSDRVPESIGRGALLVHPRVEGVTDGSLYSEGDHLLCWEAGDWDGLGVAIDSALADPEARTRIAKAGQEHVLAEHTYTVRMQQLLKTLRDRGLVNAWLVGERGPELFRPPEDGMVVSA